MDDAQEIYLRRQAVDMFYGQKQSKAAICRALKHSRPWLDRWLKRYAAEPAATSLATRSQAPHKQANAWSEEMRQRVLELHALRKQQPYALRGAQALHYELEHLGFAPVPSVSTIDRWLDEAGLVKKRKQPRPLTEPIEIPLPQAEQVNDVQQLDLKGPIYVRGDGRKRYWVVLRDRYSRCVSLGVLASRTAQGIVDFLVASWQWLGLPRILQMDNALEFRGSNRYPRSLGPVARLALNAGVDLCYIPFKRPCYNGCVERYNGFLEDRLHAVYWPTVEALLAESHSCQETSNHDHRLHTLEGKAPHEVWQQAFDAGTVRLLAPTVTSHHLLAHKPKRGTVTFLRKVRKSGRITIAATDRFMVDPALHGCYVAAEVDVSANHIAIKYKGNTVVNYDYSAKTVGAWADGICNASLDICTL